jgi:CIC family chloride channel protein
MNSSSLSISNNRIVRQVLRLSSGQKMLLFSVIVGLASGLAATGFYWMLSRFVHVFLIARSETLSVWRIAIILFSPAFGGLVCGILLHYFSPDARGGVAEVIDAILHRNGYFRPRVGVFKAFASAICIGSGGSAGREGPVVQIGASVGSTLAQIFRVPRKNSQIHVASGAAAGIAAVFNAPIAGAFFAAEIITGRFEMKDLTLLFTASALGAGVARTLLQSRAAFDIPTYELINIWALVFHAILGVLCALVAHVFILLLHESEKRFGELQLPSYIKPALGGLLVGIIGLWVPQVFGTGGEILESILQNPLAPGLLLLWMVSKLITTPLTLGSGGSGGDLMPSLFIGGTLGAAFGHWANYLFPSMTMPAGAFGLVGATAFFAAMAHAPMTAIILGFEMGHDYGVILPLMVACSVSSLVARHFRAGSLYTGKLLERGIDVEKLRHHPAEPLDVVRVFEVMTRDPISVSPDLSIQELSKLFIQEGKHGFIVVENGKLFGIVTQADVQRSLENPEAAKTVRDISMINPAVCLPTDTLHQAITKFGELDIGRMPVVAENDHTRAVGILTRKDVLRGYGIGLIRTKES